MGPKQEKQARLHLQGQVSRANSFNVARPGMKNRFVHVYEQDIGLMNFEI